MSDSIKIIDYFIQVFNLSEIEAIKMTNLFMLNYSHLIDEEDLLCIPTE